MLTTGILRDAAPAEAQTGQPKHLIAPFARLIVVTVAVLAVAYNAVLAFANAHVTGMGFLIVAATEGLLLAAGLGVVVGSGLRRSDAVPMALLVAITVIALGESIANGFIYPDPLRNFAIIAVFTMLGARCDRAMIRAAFLIGSLLALACLVLEIASLPTYVALFQPASYIENTRGVAQSQFNDTGLFANALGFEGRFSFGLFNTPRTSSIFMEQVSLASYSAVLCVYLLSYWRSIRWWEKLVHVLLVFLILTSNNTRMASGLAAVSIVGYFVYPYLPRYANLAIGPLLAIGAAVAVPLFPPSNGDDLIGRLTVTVSALKGMDLVTLVGGSVARSKHFMDSGYAYIVYSSSLFGMIAFWLYAASITPQRDAEQRRCAWSANLYLFAWLLIGGTAVFSIKVAALLWLLIGFERSRAAEAATRASATPRKRLEVPNIGPAFADA